MARIDELVEECEAQVSKIKYRPVRDFIRGVIAGMDAPASCIELTWLRSKGSAGKMASVELYTLGGKSVNNSLIDHKKVKRETLSDYLIVTAPTAIGIALGGYLTIATHCVPWAVCSIIDFGSYYVRKKQKRLR